MRFIASHFVTIYFTTFIQLFSALVNQYIKANIVTRTYNSSFKLRSNHFFQSFSFCGDIP